MANPLFINEFQKGASETGNIGFGAMVGVENYSVKGVLQLTKDTTKTSGSVVGDLPVFFASATESEIFCQGDTGRTYRSTDTGATWTEISPAGYVPVAGAGKGLIFYGTILLAFRLTVIDYCVSPYGSADWTTGWQTGLTTGVPHFPFLFPYNNFVYFANGNFVGQITTVTGMTFHPSNSATYTYSATQLTLPNTYQVNCISYLPYDFVALGTGSSGIGNSSQVADLILWNPNLSTYEAPLRLFSQAAASSAGINQIINRNNVLYCVTGGNHAIFSTNGTSFQLVDDISLHSSSRLLNGTTTSGAQATAPIFINQYPSAIAVSGNKLFTGVSTSVNSNPNGYGLFPLGVWSTAFTPEGPITQCEFTISSGKTCGTTFSIGAVYPINQAQLLIGWYDGTNYGIDQTNFLGYQDIEGDVYVESPMMEIGTPLTPAVIQNVQYNLVRNLMNGQEIDVYWRTGFDQNYTLFTQGTFVPLGVPGNPMIPQTSPTGGYQIVANSIGATRYIQILTEISTGGNVGGSVTTNGTTSVVGSGTTFNQLLVGDYITIAGVTSNITAITDDTHITTAGTFSNGSGQAYYLNLNFTPQIRNIIVTP